ncbi:MAG: hypothetical protein HY952_07660, partial [Elusimicrobia bacterium]|nr:hypothetical protein [Elusimicrobiota bacterium]
AKVNDVAGSKITGVGSIVADRIAAGTLGATVVASSVPAANIGVGKLGAQVVASSIALGGVYTDAIAAAAITDAKVNDVAGSKITGVGSIVADRIAAGTLGVSVVASSVPAANIGVGKLGAQVVASSLAVNSVYSGAIAAGAVTATSIGAGTLGATVVASSVPAANVGVGWLGAQVVASSIAVNAVQDNSIVGISSAKLSGGISPTLVNLSTVAALSFPNTFTSSQTIAAIGGLAVNFGLNAGTVTLTGGITASSATLTGDAEVRGGLLVGGGTKITKHLSASFPLDFGTVGAVPECMDSAGQTITGAALGDTVVVSADIPLPLQYSLSGYVSVADTVKVRWCQFANAATDPDGAGANYRVDVWKH